MSSLADLADGVTVVPFHPKHAQWVKDRVELLAMVTHQHFTVSDSHESRFHLDSSDGRSRVYRRIGERYADACVIQRQSFGGGSVMVWGGITAHGNCWPW
jgi:hypothetical protein